MDCIHNAAAAQYSNCPPPSELPFTGGHVWLFAIIAICLIMVGLMGYKFLKEKTGI